MVESDDSSSYFPRGKRKSRRKNRDRAFLPGLGRMAEVRPGKIKSIAEEISAVWIECEVRRLQIDVIRPERRCHAEICIVKTLGESLGLLRQREYKSANSFRNVHRRRGPSLYFQKWIFHSDVFWFPSPSGRDDCKCVCQSKRDYPYYYENPS